MSARTVLNKLNDRESDLYKAFTDIPNTSYTEVTSSNYAIENTIYWCTKIISGVKNIVMVKSAWLAYTLKQTKRYSDYYQVLANSDNEETAKKYYIEYMMYRSKHEAYKLCWKYFNQEED